MIKNETVKLYIIRRTGVGVVEDDGVDAVINATNGT